LDCSCWLSYSAQRSSPRTKKAGEAKPATLIVKVVADSDVTLTIDGEETKQTGAERTFKTPPLKPGVRYYYALSAVWEPNNYTKITRPRSKVYIEAGQTVTVDMTKADAKDPDKILVRYVPTPQEVVDAMLKMGKVGKDDIVFDLGCGDGRIPVTAVGPKYKAKRAVGIDIDPERIADSNKNAKEAGVTDKVKFRQDDVLKLKDLSEATVVTLYMGEDLNLAMKPILRRTLKPGSRIVSHRFTMGDWKPDRTENLTVEGIPYQLHLWTIPGKPDDKAKEKEKEKDKGKKKDDDD